MSLYLALQPDATSVVSDLNPIQTKHSSDGEPVTVPVYIYNDGKRKNVTNDTNPPPLIYTNLRFEVQGVSYTLQQAIDANISTNVLTFDSIVGWNIGTILKAGTERMYILELLSATSIRVTRNYTADGKSSSITGHSVGEVITAETGSVQIALPDPSDATYATPGTFASTISVGVDPSILTQAIDSQEASNVIKSNNALKYVMNSILKVDSEQMKVVAISGNDIQVIRGYNSTTRTAHSQNATIYCVGIVDIAPTTHKIFVKNDPPAGLPTQKKKDVKIVLIADEEPL